ncbi:MAG: hypothetical protein ACREPL_03250 [Rhodanobacteraceae bacterium]
MLVRVLFLLLVALNLGAGAWLLFGHEPARTPLPAADPGVAELRLVSEAHPAPRPSAVTPGPSAASARGPESAPESTSEQESEPMPKPASAPATSVAPSTTAVPAATSASAATSALPLAETCSSLGPFTSVAAMQATMQALSVRVSRTRDREEPVSRSRGYWVYLPAATSHEAALDETRALAAKGAHDYYIVSSGDMQNAISLGMYDSAANAATRVAGIQKLGFSPQVRQQFDTEPAYWVAYALPVHALLDWRALLRGRNDLQSKTIGCF